MIVIADESRMSERGLHSGPQSGGYFPISFTTGTTMTADATFVWKAPFPCRIVHVSCDSEAATTANYSVDTTAGSVIALRPYPTTVEVFTPGGALDLNAVASANRSLAEGHTLSILFDVAVSLVGGCLVVMLYSQGHPTVWTSDLD